MRFLAGVAAVGLYVGSWLLAFGVLPLRSQPVTQIYSVLMCPTGGSDAQGVPFVAPCGSQGSPVIVSVTPLQTPLAPACKANPLSGKIPPLC